MTVPSIDGLGRVYGCDCLLRRGGSVVSSWYSTGAGTRPGNSDGGEGGGEAPPPTSAVVSRQANMCLGRAQETVIRRAQSRHSTSFRHALFRYFAHCHKDHMILRQNIY